MGKAMGRGQQQGRAQRVNIFDRLSLPSLVLGYSSANCGE